jgi:hypothetical protein
MSQNVTFNGQVYVIPDLADNNWGQNVTDYLVALPQGALQKTAGAFTLAADVDFGASYGLKSAYYSTRAANPASAGLVRLANTDTVVWRNAGNSGDLALAVNGSNQLTFNGVILESDTLPSAYIFVGNASNESTGVPMTGDIGIDNTGLTAIQNGVIINTDINASAAIAMSKLAALTASKSVVSDGSGFLATGWGYASGDMLTTANGALRFQDSAGGDYVGFAAPASVTTHTYLLPIAAGLNGQVLSWTTGGQLAWINASGTGTINSGTAGRFAYYAATGTTLSDQALLTTDGTNITLASGHFLTPDGTALLPSYSFSGDPDTGIYSYGTNYIGLSTAGVVSWAVGPTGQLLGLISTSTIHVADGSASTPSVTFRNDTNNGIYLYGTDSIGFATAGLVRAVITSTGRTQFSDGAIGTPSISFMSDPDTGIYWNSADKFSVVTNGSDRLTFDGSSISSWALFRVSDGTAASPSLSFINDINTGFYSTGADEMAITVGGGMKWRFYSNNQMTSNGNGTVSNPVYSFENDLDTGIYLYATGQMAFTAGGVVRAYITTSGLTLGTGTLNNNNGSGSAPSYTFSDESGLGWYRSTTGAVTLAYNSTNLVNFRGVNGDARFILDLVAPNHHNLGTETDYWGRIFAKGTTTNDSASTGFLGEYVESVVSAVSFPATTAWGDATSISLTAGDWDVSFNNYYNDNGATITGWRAGISTTSGNSTTGMTLGSNHIIRSPANTTDSDSDTIAIVNYRISLSSTTTVYAKFRADYTIATPVAYGRLSARRVR